MGGVVAVLLLGLTELIQGVPLLSEPLYPTQENFDLDRFLGKWHDVAVASNCPWMKRRGGERAIGSLKLAHAVNPSKLVMTRQVLRHGSCEQILGEYDITDTPGRFTYDVARWGASVDAYVVHTVYDEYAIVIMNMQKSGGESSITIRLYSRSMTVRPTVMEDFKRLAREQGMDDDAIYIHKDKGECVPGVTSIEPAVETVVQRSRRNVVLPTLGPEEEGSADEESQKF